MDRVRFSIERLLLRGLFYRLLLAAAIVALVALIGGALVALLDPGFDELNDAVWWAFLRLTDPGYLGDDEGAARRVVSTVVTVLGYVLFLGMLIAILTQWLNGVFAKLESGVTPITLSDHVLVLGWTHRTPTIVSRLLRTGNRVQRFLERHDARGLRIVILTERVDDGLSRELRERLGTLWNDRQVLLRSGSPLRIDHLERVCFGEAAAIILPGADHAERNPEAVDAQTIKTLLSVSKHASASDAVAPLAVAEIYDSRRGEVARRAYAGDCEIVAADLIISRLIAQSVLQPGLRSVFSELFSLDEGNAVYLRELPDRSGARFSELRGAFPKAIPIGLVRSVDRRLVLSPGPDAVLETGDELVFLARRYRDCVADPSACTNGPDVTTQPRQPALERRRVLILGWSRKAPALLRELQEYGRGAFEIDVVSARPIEEREQALALHASSVTTDHLRHHEARFTVPGVLERLQPERYENIILLASERLESEEQADANTVVTYLMLRGLLPEGGSGPEIFVELLDEENQFLFDDDRTDMLVSSLVVGYLLSQVALRRELAAVFSELSRPWGQQPLLQPASDYVSDGGPVRFGDIERAAATRGEIALGIRRARGVHADLSLNPDRDTEWMLEPDDQVVVLASYAEPTTEV